MPSTVIHESVAKKIASKYKKLNNYDFYLGSTAPDAVNLNGFAEKEIRWYAHLRDKNLDTWKNNIINFYKSEKENYNSSFLKGYILHIMTDIIYDEIFYDRVAKKIQSTGVLPENTHKTMLKEFDKFQCNNKTYQEIKDIFKSSTASYDIRNIDKILLLKWKDKIINEEVNNEKSAIITEELVDDLANETLKVLEDYNVI